MKIYDFLDNKLKNLNNEEVKLYVCGPTVYDELHVGNIRPIITYDLLIRLLLFKKHKFNYVTNITDIDDKIIKKANQEKKTEKEISEFYTLKYFDLLEKLNIVKANHYPKVTDNIKGIIDFIKELVDKDLAYESNGNVFMSIKNVNNYGDLVNLNLDHLEDHEEEGITELKKDKQDFTLWKKTKEGILFDSPWGKGRPGWHTECSFFVKKFFNSKTIDLHGGGIDLKFPHHVNEKAQFEALYKKPMSNIWSYVGHLNINQEKMSKSLGNIYKAKDFISDYSENILKNIFFSLHYSKPINLSNDVIKTSKTELEKWRSTLTAVYKDLIVEDVKIEHGFIKEELVNALQDDLNTTKYKEILISMIKELPSLKGKEKSMMFSSVILSLELLGFKIKLNDNQDIINNFKQALKNKEFKISDEIRDSLVVL